MKSRVSRDAEEEDAGLPVMLRCVSKSAMIQLGFDSVQLCNTYADSEWVPQETESRIFCPSLLPSYC